MQRHSLVVLRLGGGQSGEMIQTQKAHVSPILSHVPLFPSVCGLPPTSRRNCDWSPGSNPKREATLWALLFPTQVWVLVFAKQLPRSLRNMSHLTLSVPHASGLPRLFIFSASTLKTLKPNVLVLGLITVNFICLSSKNPILLLIMFINILAAGAPSMWPVCRTPDYWVSSRITGKSCWIKLWKHSGTIVHPAKPWLLCPTVIAGKTVNAVMWCKILTMCGSTGKVNS